MKDRKIVFRTTLLFQVLVCICFIWIKPPKAEASNLYNPPSAISLDGIFTVPSTSNSYLLNDKIVAVTTAKSQKGAIWSTENNKMDLTRDFEATMYMYFGNQGKNAADGMAFVMHNDPSGVNTVGKNAGASLGVWAEAKRNGNYDSIQNSFAIEFDTHVNADGFDYDVRNGQHIAWNYPGERYTYEDKSTYRKMIHHDVQYIDNLSNDTWRKFSIKWNAANQTLTYQLEGLSAVTVSIDVQDVFGTTEVFWGFTGATGSLYEENAIAFDEVPDLVNATAVEKILKADGTLVTSNTPIYSGEELTYIIYGKYDSGKQDWKDVSFNTKINDFVTYVPGTLTLKEADGTIKDLDDNQWSSQVLPISIGTLNTKDNEVVISFRVKVNTVLEDTVVNEFATFAGTNLIKSTTPISYTIKGGQAPVVTIDDPGNISIPGGQDYTITGTWSDLDSEAVDLYYVIDDGEPVKFATEENVANKGDAVRYEYTIPASQLSVGTHAVTVYCIDDMDIKSNEATITLIVTGTLAFQNVSENIHFENTKISDTPTISKRLEGWNITVQDTRSGNSTWRVTAALSEEFSDDKGHYLEDALIYVDADGNEKSMRIGDAVNVFEHTTMDENEVSISWDEDKGILLKISPYFYAGEYTGILTWALVDAP